MSNGQAEIGTSSETGTGMLGYAFLGKAHSSAFLNVHHIAWPAPLRPRLVAIAGRDEAAVAEAAERYGYERWTTDWRDIVSDPSIGLFDNGGPNSVHAEPTIAAAQASGVLCRRSAVPPRRPTKHLVARGRDGRQAPLRLASFVPAVRLARELIDAGELGEIRHFRARYLQDWAEDPGLDTWRFSPEDAGSGAIGDLATHVIDLSRFLVGEIEALSAVVKGGHPGPQGRRRDRVGRRVPVRAVGHDQGDAALPRLPTQLLPVGDQRLEGVALVVDMERMNELQVFRADGDRARGAKTVLVTEADHPFMSYWWPPGHIVGWGDTFTHEIVHLLEAIAEDRDVAPLGATFEDGYRASEVCDAIVRSSAAGSRVTLAYRSL